MFCIGDDGGRRKHSDGGKETKISIEIGTRDRCRDGSFVSKLGGRDWY